MAEHFLDGAQVGALAEQVGGEAVAQRRGATRASPRFPARGGRACAGPRGRPCAARGAKETAPAHGWACLHHQQRDQACAQRQIVRQRLPRLAARGHDAILAALALAHGDLGAGRRRPPRRPRRGGRPRRCAGRCRTAPRTGPGRARFQRRNARFRPAIEQARGLFLAQKRGQVMGAFGTTQGRERTRGDELAPHQQAKEGLERRQLATHAGRIVLAVQAGQKRSAGDGIEILCLSSGAASSPVPAPGMDVRHQLFQVGQIRAHGVGRRSASRSGSILRDLALVGDPLGCTPRPRPRPQPQPTAMQRRRVPERETFCTMKTAPHCGHGLGMGRSHDTKSHFDLA
jgi:hypothetical protein